MNEHKKMPGTVGTVTEQNINSNITIAQKRMESKICDAACEMECVAASMDTLQNLCGIFGAYISSCIRPEREAALIANALPDVLTMLDTVQALAESAEREAEGGSGRLYQLAREVGA